MRTALAFVCLVTAACADTPPPIPLRSDAASPARADSTAGAAPLYYLSLEVSGARVTAFLNGLPVYRSEIQMLRSRLATWPQT